MSRQTDYRHDDYKVQREFERLKKEKVSAQVESTSSPTPTTGTSFSTTRTTPRDEVIQYELTSPNRTIAIKRNAGQNTVRYEIERPFTIRHNDQDVQDGSGSFIRTQRLDFHDSPTVRFTVQSGDDYEVEVLALSPLTIARSFKKLQALEEFGNEITDIWFDNETQNIPSGYDSRIYFKLGALDDQIAYIEGWYKDTATTELTIYDDGVAVGGSDTVELEFDSNGQSSTDVPVRMDVFDDGSGRRRLRAWVPAAGAGYTGWVLEVDSVAREVINDSDDVDLVSGTGITLGGAARQVVINVDATPYRQTNEQNANQESYDVVPGDIIEFENATEAKPAGYTKRVWLDLAQVGSILTVEGWYEDTDNDTIYSGWLLEVNGVLRENIDAGDDVDFIDGIATTVVGSGRQIQIDRPLQIKNAGVNVGDNATIALNADPQGQTSTDVAVNLQWIDDGSGQRTLRGWIPSAVAGYTGWNLEANGVLRELINDAEDVDFINGNGTTIGGTGRQIQVNVIDSTLKQVNDENANEESYTYTPGHSLSFSNETEAKPVTYTQRVWFDLSSAAGAHVLEAFVENPTSAYFFTISANGGATEQIDSGENVDLSGSNGTVVVVRAGNNFQLTSPLTIQEDGVSIGANDTVVLNFDNAVPTKPSGYTKQAWVDIIDEGSGVRRAVIWYEDLTGITAYSWFLKGGNADTGTEISNSEIVTIVGEGRNNVRRVGNTIIVSSNGDDASGTIDNDRRIKRGILTLWTDQLPEPGYYGVQVVTTIDHNWDLSNMHGWHLRMETVQFNETRDPAAEGVVEYHWGDPYPTGLAGKLGNVTYESMPKVYATDENTIEVRATIPKLNGAVPRPLKYFYVLEEV